jgi:hypothetical protein
VVEQMGMPLPEVEQIVILILPTEQMLMPALVVVQLVMILVLAVDWRVMRILLVKQTVPVPLVARMMSPQVWIASPAYR